MVGAADRIRQWLAIFHPSVKGDYLVCRATEASRRSALALATALLIAGSHAAAETLVNGDLIPPAPVVSGQSYNSTPVTDGPGGTFSFIATVCNGDNNGAGAQGEGLESRTATLTNGNVLLNRESGTPPGVDSVLKFPETGDYADKSLAPGECVAVPYQIGLQARARFELYVDFWLPDPVTPATCTQCTGIDCIVIPPPPTLCGAGQDVCTTQTVDSDSVGRNITRACELSATAQAQAGMNDNAYCEAIESGPAVDGQTCTFACDGVNFVNCNVPPALIPVNGRLFAP